MIVEFYDRQDELNALNGTRITESDRLLQIIGDLIARPPFFCELVGENGYNLLIGVGGMFGCAQYSHDDGTPPYLMATTSEAQRGKGEIEFMIGGTPTPVPARYCLPFDNLKAIVVHFQTTGDQSPFFDWEEVGARCSDAIQ
jgi:hypothetical protein